MGVAMSRLILAGHLKLNPAEVVIDRTCGQCGEPHGRPRLAGGGGLDFSVSHSGDLIAVAVVRDRRHDGPADRAVGVDVEQVVALREPSLPRTVLSAAEYAAFDRCQADSKVTAFFRYWVRKEAVLKATGDGLTVPLSQLTVSGPDRPAALQTWPERPHLPATVTMHDLYARPGYAAAVALIGRAAEVREWDAATLLPPP
jgi:4'-phosphopantetheinyl transferase